MADDLKSSDMNYSKVFIKSTLRSSLNGFLIRILNDSSGITGSFEDATIQVATTFKSLPLILPVVASDTADTAPIAGYAAQIVKQEVKESVKD